MRLGSGHVWHLDLGCIRLLVCFAKRLGAWRGEAGRVVCGLAFWRAANGADKVCCLRIRIALGAIIRNGAPQTADNVRFGLCGPIKTADKLREAGSRCVVCGLRALWSVGLSVVCGWGVLICECFGLRLGKPQTKLVVCEVLVRPRIRTANNVRGFVGGSIARDVRRSTYGALACCSADSRGARR